LNPLKNNAGDGGKEGERVTNTTGPYAMQSQSPLFTENERAQSDMQYRLLPSVWQGEDAELLEVMLDFYPHMPPQLILDATVNAGRFWRGSQRPVIGLDINPRYRPDIVGDNRHMPFRDESFDVVVYDPPHIPNQGKDRSKDLNTRFGLVLKSSAVQGYNFSHLYLPFVREAYRLLKPQGILLCKIADYVHNHRLQWAHVDVIQAATAAGFCPCDCIVKIRKGPIVDPKWQVAHHARRHHCYWIIFRKSEKCE
jgi:SAM-dependent methyltransferase